MNTDAEIVFEQKIVDIAHMHGWKVASFRQAGSPHDGYRTPVKHDAKGWPDLTLIHPNGYIIFAEIKKEKNPSPYTDDQKSWGATLAATAERINEWLEDSPDRVFYRLWRPRDGDEIVTLLSFGRVRTWTP